MVTPDSLKWIWASHSYRWRSPPVCERIRWKTESDKRQITERGRRWETWALKPHYHYYYDYRHAAGVCICTCVCVCVYNVSINWYQRILKKAVTTEGRCVPSHIVGWLGSSLSLPLNFCFDPVPLRFHGDACLSKQRNFGLERQINACVCASESRRKQGGINVRHCICAPASGFRARSSSRRCAET